jgi:spermidine synthase
VVEISAEVMSAAQSYFGLCEDEVVRCHVADGSKFIAQAEANSYDFIAIDAADHDASDGGPHMEAPPLCLYTQEFLR